MDPFALAEAAIEAFIRSRQDWQHWQNTRWTPVKPNENLQYSFATWVGALNGIIADFESRIGFRIAVSVTEKANSYELTLGHLWLFLVRKAETISKYTIIKKFNQKAAGA